MSEPKVAGTFPVPGSRHKECAGYLQEDIAIVGMGCLLPRADSPTQFWQNIVRKVDGLSDPAAGSAHERYSRPDTNLRQRIYTGRGGYLGDLSRFNPMKYGVMPAGIDGAEPDQFLALRCAFDTLADAGIPDLPLNRERTAVILGRGVYSNRGVVSVFLHGFALDQFLDVLHKLEPQRSEADLDLIRQELERSLPPFTSETVPGLVHCSMTGRIANRFDLKGPAYTLDAACASSLIAVEHGLRELRLGHCDAVLAGGVTGSITLFVHQLFCRIDALSKSGRIAPFSKHAQGTMLGEGCAMLLLKRRSDAERDGNRIYALVKEVGVSSDGRGAGLLAPRTEGQQLAIQRAYDQAGIEPTTISLIEAHGTGIPVGDKTEVASLHACFGPRANGLPTVGLGSVKSNIGHLIPAAGAAAIIKAALALYHRTLPPTLNAEEADPELGLERTPFYLCTQPRPWIHGDETAPRRAGINAFGFGGINAHTILEEYPADEPALERLETEWPVELLVISAADRARLQRRLTELSHWLSKADGIRLLDVAAACADEVGPCRLALVAPTVAELVKKLDHAALLLAEAGRERIQDRSGIFWYQEPLTNTGRVAFVFPGAGAQYPHMLADLCRHFPEVRRQFDLCDAGYRRFGAKKPLSRLVFPLPEEEKDAEAELFVPPGRMISVMTAERGLLALLENLGIKPDAVVGHSSGEFIAFQAAGAFESVDEEALIHSIVCGLQNDTRQATPGLVPEVLLTAVGGVNPSVIEEVLAASEGKVTLAIDNCPHQVVLAGDEAATVAALERLKGKGGLCERVPVKALHTEAFAAAARVTAEFFEQVHLVSPRVELWSCTHASLYPTKPAELMELASAQLRCKLRFRETVEAMYAAGVRVFVEVGPRNSLSGFIADTLGKRPHLAVPLDVPRRPGLEQLCRALAMLVAHGVPLNLPELYRRRKPTYLDLNAAPPPRPNPEPFLEKEIPALRVNEETAARWQESAPKPVSKPNGQLPASPVPTAAPTAPALAQVDARTQMLADYQQTMRQFLETQQQVAFVRFGTRTQPVATAQRATEPVPAEPIPTRTAGTSPTARQAPAARDVPVPIKMPFLDVILTHVPNQRLLAECELDVGRHRFLLDHTFFGRGLSLRDPDLTALAVMPLAMMLELMAEAAVTLRPGLVVTALRDVRMHRWQAFETPTRRVRMEASVQDGGEVHVTVLEADREGMSAVLAECVIDLSVAGPDLGPPTVPDSAVTPYPWGPNVLWGRTQADVYGQVVFHGPALRGILTIDALDPHAGRATVREPALAGLLPTGSTGDLVLPAGLIDQCGQLAVFGLVRQQWTRDEILLAFPTRLARVEFLPNRDRSATLRAVARMREEGTKLHSDVEFLNAAGRVVLRVLGREEEIIRLPADLYTYWATPRQVHLGRDISRVFSGVPGVEACTVCELGNVASKVLVNRLWATVLGRMILSARERRTFDGLKLPPLPAASWLLGRAAVKDAVRLRGGLDVCMADVELDASPQGQPQARVPLGTAPHVSLAHKGFAAVAVAADASRVAGVGIDLEPLGPMDAGVRADAFTSAECERIENAARTAGESVESWYLSAWTAKEAVGKALGRGVLGGPRTIEVVEIEPRTGRLGMSLVGAMAAAFPGHAGKLLDAYRRLHGEQVLALCLV